MYGVRGIYYFVQVLFLLLSTIKTSNGAIILFYHVLYLVLVLSLFLYEDGYKYIYIVLFQVYSYVT